MTTTTNSAIRPFKVHVPDDDLAGLRRRIAATRWPDPETVTDESQGVPLAMIQELAGYGLDIHFIHVRSSHDHALPLIVTHGWPGSIIEQLKIIGPLTDPTAHGAAASDTADLTRCGSLTQTRGTGVPVPRPTPNATRR